MHSSNTSGRLAIRYRFRHGGPTADALFAGVAGFGLTIISDALIDQQAWLRLIGGLFLCCLGIRTLMAESEEKAAPARGNGLVGAYASTLLLTITNPMTILSFAAFFASSGLENAGGRIASAGLTVLGVFLGSSLWWLALSGGVYVFRERFGRQGMQWVNRISGAFIAGFGLIVLLS